MTLNSHRRRNKLLVPTKNQIFHIESLSYGLIYLIIRRKKLSVSETRKMKRSTLHPFSVTHSCIACRFQDLSIKLYDLFLFAVSLGVIVGAAIGGFLLLLAAGVGIIACLCAPHGPILPPALRAPYRRSFPIQPPALPAPYGQQFRNHLAGRFDPRAFIRV